jgi:hypothetical protein
VAKKEREKEDSTHPLSWSGSCPCLCTGPVVVLRCSFCLGHCGAGVGLAAWSWCAWEFVYAVRPASSSPRTSLVCGSLLGAVFSPQNPQFKFQYKNLN